MQQFAMTEIKGASLGVAEARNRWLPSLKKEKREQDFHHKIHCWFK